MARLPALIDLIGKCDPRGVVAIENYTRILRRAGKISPSKRGVGASHVTVADAANLLLGLAESRAIDAPAAVDMLRSARLVAPWDGEPDPLDDLLRQKVDLNFGAFGDLVESILAGGWRNDAVQSIALRLEKPTVSGGSAYAEFELYPEEAGANLLAVKTVTLRYDFEHPDFPRSRLYEERVEDWALHASHAARDSGIAFDLRIAFSVLREVTWLLQYEEPV